MDYIKIGKDITLNGFFSEYLPPCFVLSHEVLSITQPKKINTIEPISFTMSRFDEHKSRRTIHVPEILSYLSLMDFLKKSPILKIMLDVSQNNTYSFSKILTIEETILWHDEVYNFGGEYGSNDYDDDQNYEIFRTEAINPISDDSNIYINNINKKIIKSSGARGILKIDISNCFSSFYTHNIPLIKFELKEAKQIYGQIRSGCHEKEHKLYRLFQEFDEKVRNINEKRTNGLLVGPLVSRLIIESILSKVDSIIANEGIKFSRYMDDYEIFIYDNNEEAIKSKISEILRSYGFSLNNNKTEFVEFPYYVVKDLSSILRKKIMKRKTSELFSSFFTLENEGVVGAIRFLVKALQGSCYSSYDDVQKGHLLSILTNYKRALANVCDIIINNQGEFRLSKDDIEMLEKQLELCIINKHDLEAIWVTYLLIKTKNIDGRRKIVNLILEQGHELLIAMVLKTGIVNSKIKSVKQNAKSWLLLYELFSNDFMEIDELKSSLGINANHSNFYKILKRKKINFVNL